MRNVVLPHVGKITLLMACLLANFFNPVDYLRVAFTSNQLILLQELNSIFLSIIIEALPLVLIGVLVSAYIHTFVSADFIQRLIPRNRIIGIVVASLLGIVFPLCECGMVPIVKRLIIKGVPPFLAIAFMLSAPVINPLVAISTYFAFSSYPTMVIYRLLGTLLCATIIAYLLSIGSQANPLYAASDTEHPYCGHHHHRRPNFITQTRTMLNHACDEFFDMGSFLLIGSFLAAIMQVAVPRTALLTFGQDSLASILGMMGFAFVISVCSQADAFIAAPFLASFTTGSIAAFLIYGPMLDIKNTLMLFSSFKPTFVMKLIFIITVVVFCLSISINYFPHIWEVIVGGYH
jgi:uncharacterized protein